MTEIEQGSINVYEDLGYDDAERMQVKAALAAKIGDIIKRRGLTQTEAAVILGMTQPKLSAMLNGRFRGISESKMIDCLNHLGRDVEIVVRKPARTRRPGQTRVVVV